jgi:hypothetical protein
MPSRLGVRPTGLAQVSERVPDLYDTAEDTAQLHSCSLIVSCPCLTSFLEQVRG